MTKEERRVKYKELKASMPPLTRCSVCLTLSPTKQMDPHHISGRSSDNLLEFIMVHRKCHDFIHEHPRWAREHNFLVYSYDIERKHHGLLRSLQGGEAEIANPGALEET